MAVGCVRGRRSKKQETYSKGKHGGRFEWGWSAGQAEEGGQSRVAARPFESNPWDTGFFLFWLFSRVPGLSHGPHLSPRVGGGGDVSFFSTLAVLCIEHVTCVLVSPQKSTVRPTRLFSPIQTRGWGSGGQFTGRGCKARSRRSQGQSGLAHPTPAPAVLGGGSTRCFSWQQKECGAGDDESDMSRKNRAP